MEWRKQLGEQIREGRTDLSLTQAELCNLADVHVNSISRYETGQAAPELDVFLRLAVALDREKFTIGDFEVMVRNNAESNTAPRPRQLRLEFGNEYVFDDGEALMKIQPSKAGLVILSTKRTA